MQGLFRYSNADYLLDEKMKNNWLEICLRSTDLVKQRFRILCGQGR
ncbi:MAG: hypothetical protein ACLR8B_03995 [Peptoniphilus harei]